MNLGRIVGKVTTQKFDFLVDGDARKFMYCQVQHPEYGDVLCQILELEKTVDRVLAKCSVIGYKDGTGGIRSIRTPFDIDTPVKRASEAFIKNVIMPADLKSGAYLGLLEGTKIPVHLDLNTLLTKHLAVLAKSGSGKSYAVGVLLEEIMERNVPLVVIDPHDEYSTLAEKNDNAKDVERMKDFKVKPKGFKKKIEVYGDIKVNPHVKPLKLNEEMSSQEFIDLLPLKLSNNQLGMLYSAVKSLDEFDFESLLIALNAIENNQKWNIIHLVEHLKDMELFSSSPTSLNEIVQSGKCSIINLKGIPPDEQGMIVSVLLNNLFAERKKGTIPPFFLVVEEAHNFVPEKGFSDAKSSKIIKTIASEGRKFGLGMAIVSQRPAIVQKTVLSQASTQIILKITNPNDLKALTSSVEGITSETENEVKNLVIGNALVTGMVEMPIFVSIRPRKSKHGGEAVNILGDLVEEKEFFSDLKEFNDKKLLPVITPNLEEKDIKLIANRKVSIKKYLLPCAMFLCSFKDNQFNLLIDLTDGRVVIDTDEIPLRKKMLPDLGKMGKNDLKVLQHAFRMKRFEIEDMIKLVGFEARKICEHLEKEKYLEKQGPRYVVTDYYILTNLAKSACFKKIEFKAVEYEHMLEKKIRLDTLKAKLARVTNIVDMRECYLLQYDVS